MAASVNLSAVRTGLLKITKPPIPRTQLQRRLLVCSCRCSPVSSPVRSYYTYDNTQTPENRKFVYKWNLLRHQLGPSPLKEAPWPKQEWEPYSRRCGLLAVKLGMFPMWTKTGAKFVTTALQVQDCNVIRHIPSSEEAGRSAIEVGAKNASPIYRDKDYFHKFDDACVPVKQKTALFYVTENAIIQPGTPLYATHFRPGMLVDCCGKTIGKGFQGVMKRWGMKGQPASHGQTKTHRKMGATGGGGTPGRIRKGKKMPGPMGNRWRWSRCLKVWRINTRHNIIFVHGNIPGSKGGFVKIKDSLNNTFEEEPPPFPTYFPEDGEDIAKDLYDEEVHQMTDGSIEFEAEKEE